MTNAVPNPFWQLPPAPKPPNDPTWWLLNGRVGWQAAALDDVAIAGEDLGLLIIPGSGRLLTEASGSFGGLVLPGNAAQAADGSLYLLDAQAGQLKRFDPCDCRFQTVLCLGGVGTGARQLQDPHGIGICSGNLFICDTGNHRLLIFSLFGFVLRDSWTPPASANLTNPWQPYSVTFDNHGRVYVSDPANGCVHRFHPTGRWQAALPGFGDVRWITFDCRNRLYAVINGQDSIRITDREGKLLGTASRPDEVAVYFPKLTLRVDARGDLDLSSICKPAGPPDCAGFARAGVGGSSGIFDPGGGPLTSAPPDPPAAFAASGTYWSKALDSEFYRCQWHRIVLGGKLPAKTAIYISTFTTEIEFTLDQIQALPESVWATNMTVTPAALSPQGAQNRCGPGEYEALIFSGPGRYLWLRLELAGNGSATPVIASIKLEFPRISLRRYLPAVFAEDPNGADFTDRFLSIFDTTFRGIEHKIDYEASYFDPRSAPAEPKTPGGVDFLSWLGSWIGVSLDRLLPVKKRRQILEQEGAVQCIRGTRLGLWKQLLLFLGMQPETVCCPQSQPKKLCVSKPLNCAPPNKDCAWEPPALILENYQLRRWLFLGAGRLGDDAVLWGRRIINRSQLSTNAQAGVTQLLTTPDPFHDPFLAYSNKFTVFVPAQFGASDQKRRGLINLLEAEKPAHTQYQIEYVTPRMRIGFQSMIGLDSVVGRYPSGVTVGQKLGKDSVLSGAPAQGGPSFGIGWSSRIGPGSKLD
jgi:phage tail-like protein